ncbi:MAG: LON peptidase substrate-binding domain-containing protein [Alphaproteobacteria bacterium]
MKSNSFDPDFDDLPTELPIFPLRAAFLLPHGQLPLNIFEPRYLEMIAGTLAGSRMIGMIQPAADIDQSRPVADDVPLFPIGCAGRIVAFQEADNRLLITLKGICRFTIAQELPLHRGYRRIRPDFSAYADDLEPEADDGIDRDRLLGSLRAYFTKCGFSAEWESVERAPTGRLVTTLAMVCPFDADEKQALLESPDAARRAKMMIGLIEATLRGDDPTASGARH